MDNLRKLAMEHCDPEVRDAEPPEIEIAPGVPVDNKDYRILEEISRIYGSTPRDDYLMGNPTSPKKLVIEAGRVTEYRIYNYPGKTLPKSLLELDALTDFTVYGGNLEELPDIGKLRNLRVISVTHCPLRMLPESFYDLGSLEEMFVYNTNLEKLGEGLGNLRKLRSISIFGNKLTEVPGSIGDLCDLRYLIVEGNSVRGLPESILMLGNLEYLDVQDNMISDLPDGIAGMRSLGIVKARGNMIGEKRKGELVGMFKGRGKSIQV